MVKFSRMLATMEKKDLEGKLREVQKIKNEDSFYLGTQSILAYIRDKEKLQQRTQKLVNRVNSSLNESAEYQATPERIYAVGEVISSANSAEDNYQQKIRKLKPEKDLVDEISAIFGVKEDYEEKFFEDLDLACLESYLDEEDKDERCSNVAVKIFKTANKLKIKTDEGFLAFLINKYIPEKLTEADEDMAQYIMKEIKDLSFDFEENYQKRKAEKIFGFNLQELSSEEIIKRLLNDKLENKWQYTRPLLTRGVKLMLQVIDISQKPEEIYQEMTEKINGIIKNCETNLAHPLKGLNKEYYEKIIQTQKFFRHLFGREKSYTIKIVKELTEKR